MAAAGRSAFTRRAAISASSASTMTWSVLPLSLNPTANFTGRLPGRSRCGGCAPGATIVCRQGSLEGPRPQPTGAKRVCTAGAAGHIMNPGTRTGGLARNAGECPWARDVVWRHSGLAQPFRRRGMSQDRADRRRPSAGAEVPRRWVRQIGLAVAVGFAYFFAAQLSLGLLTKPDGVAVFWPAAGVSAGVLIALGRSA